MGLVGIAQANGREIQRKRHGDRAGPEAEAQPNRDPRREID